MFHSFVLTPYGQHVEDDTLTASFLTSNWELYPDPNDDIPYEYNYLPYIIHPTDHVNHTESGTSHISSPLVSGRWYRPPSYDWTIGRVDRNNFARPVTSLFDLAIPTSFFPFPSFHRQANKYNLHQAIHNHLNPETMVSLREDEDQTNNVEDFEFNQDFETDETVRSPGWIRYQKKLK